MKAITVRQPYARLLACGAKRYETRSWSTKYRGPVAIHAGKQIGAYIHFWADLRRLLSLPPDAIETVGHHELPLAYYAWHELVRSIDDLHPENFAFGAILAIGELVDCIPWSQQFDDELDLRERVFGHYGEGRYAWQIDNVRPCTPVPIKGQQGLWEWTPMEALHAN